MKKIEINEGFEKAMELIEDVGKNVFLTGRAGTGKSTFLTHFRHVTKKRIVVLAPTGVAAINVGGQTIHSFFHFKPNVTLQKVRRKYKADDPTNIYKKIDAIVIDEISMVRADLLDCVDRFLRLNGSDAYQPFGGIQMIFIGDLYQLPPVVTSIEREIFAEEYTSPYFFDAKVFDDDVFEMDFIELEKIYRQKDDAFIAVLNAIRNRSAEPSHLQTLNQRYDADFEIPDGEYYIYLTTTNARADEVNRERLDALSGEIIRMDGVVSGDFAREYYPTVEQLELKIGAQVMMLNNDAAGRWVNGSIALIEDYIDDGDGNGGIIISMESGETEEVFPHTWDIYNYAMQDGKLTSDVVGSFTQYPMRLAFAITIHKSQGKTFDKAVIDIGRGTFAHGQMYVALSRCRTLEGIILKKEITLQHVRMDWHVVRFLTQFQYAQAEKTLSLEDKMSLICNAIKNKSDLQITYLKGKDEKSRRKIQPKKMGHMTYAGKEYLGLIAHCHTRNDERVFNVERILECVICE